MIFSSWIRNWRRSIERRWVLHQTIRRKSITRRSATRPRLEVLEDRRLLSTYLVNSVGDNGSGTFRDAITQANAPGSAITEIDFNIGTVGSAETINLTSQLPTLTASGVYINGPSQGGSGNTTPLITLNGSGAGASDGLLLQGSNCTVSGLIIESFSKNGIEVDGSTNTIGGTTAGAGNVISGNTSDGVLIDSGISGVLVQGNLIGTDPTGTTALANSVGVEDAGAGNTIGGTLNTLGGSVLGSRNIISGNSFDGIILDSVARGTTVESNYIGINAADKALGNGNVGMDIQGSDMVVGGTSEAARNIISGNANDGILIRSGATGNQIMGNYVGLSAVLYGNVAIANGGNGIEDAGSSNTIGGSVLGARNTISGNTDDGILLDSSASAETVQGNYIGTDVFGTNAMANNLGLEVRGNNNTIGGPSGSGAFCRNYISGNTNDGVLIDSGATGNQVQVNFIGLDIFGTSAVANGSNGIEVGGTGNTIGGTVAGLGNVLSGNKNDGILLDSAASSNVIQGNDIGTDYTGGRPLGNSGNGIEIMGNGNTLGGTVSGARNVLSGNSKNGVRIDSTASGTLIQGNFIGLNATGSTGTNAANGIEIAGVNNTIGGTISAARNIVSGNSIDGVLLDSTASGNQVLGNYIGTTAAGAAAPNSGNGIEIVGTQNTIGGTVSGALNIISGNSGDGILLAGTANANLVLRNYLGLNIYGNAVGNSANGIEVAGTNNVLGSTVGALHNFISANSDDGVLLDSLASGNQVLGNFIGTDVHGTAAQANNVGIEDFGTNNTLGGSVLGARNVLSGNTSDGILMDSTASSETVQSNYIGLDAGGKTVLANGSNGVEIKGTNNTLGGNNQSGYFTRNFISGNSGDGVLIGSNATGNQVQGNFIGLDVSGTKGAANAANGIEIADSSNSIGGTVAGLGNVLSGNKNDGILLDSAASSNVILGNDVGTDYTGKSGVANTGHGIEVMGPGNTLGGTPSGARNIISGNSKDGIMLDSTASGNQVLGNYIGTTTAGNTALANSVGIEDAGSSNTLGGSVLGARNVISGNTTDGILMDSTASGESVQGNYIGLDASGKQALANGTNGVEVQGGNNSIGGTAYYARNFISGNSNDGVLIDSSGSGNQVLGNFIGIDISGTHGVGNVDNGIEIAGTSNTIGGSAAGVGNTISGNTNDGMLLDSTASANLVQGNDVGTDYTGNAALSNSVGLEIAGSNNTIGGNSGSNYYVRNFLSGNSNDGVRIDSGGSGNQVLGNFIGLGVSGTKGVGNGTNGVEILGSSNSIGSATSGITNFISGNKLDGIVLDSTASSNAIQGNDVGTDYTGRNAVGNSGSGIEILGNGNTLGGATAGARNILSGNSGDGVRIDSGASGNVLQGNFIGLNATGSTGSNAANGINIAGSSNTIGGTASAARNIISGNGNDGVLLDSTASGNQVIGNFIGVNVLSNAVGNSIGIEAAGSGNTIGGTVSAALNIIAGNSGDGVLLDSTANANVVLRNYLGLNIYGNAVGNSGNGIEVAGTNNVLGSTVGALLNVIVANSNDGVKLDSTSSGNQVLGNFIGTNVHGTAAQANKVGIEDAGTNNTLGGSVLGARNIISGNTSDGILMDSTASSETVQSNYIGLDVSGKTVLANGSNGVEIQGNNNNLGGNNQSSYFTRNFISGNSGDGVRIDSGATGNQVLGNFIGIDISGTKGAANAASGIEIAGSGNSIGGTILGLGNTISGNTNDGVFLDSTASNNLAQGNDVGTDYTGKNALGNGGNGVNIVGNNNTVGGSVAGAGNTLADNGGDGVLVSVGVGDTLSHNSIFANSGGGISLSNGGNNNLAAATLTVATLIGNSLTVSGSFTAPTANVSYVLEFFANPSGDAEGKIYLGSLTVTPTSSGTQSFSFNTTTTVTGTNPLITATLTDAAGDTSTFSNGATS